MPRARKLANLSPYIFAQLDERVYQLRQRGAMDIVDLGKADPDRPSPDPVVKRLQEADDFMTEVIEWCRKRDILLCYDNAYSEITYDGHRATSLLQYPGGREVGLEFISFSKTYNMAGWRLGAAVGHRDAIESLLVVQSHVDSGVFAPIQFAGATAVETVWQGSFPDEQRRIYQRRRDDALARFASIGWPVEKPAGTVYLWVPVPAGMTSETFARRLLDEYHVVVAPGTAFGPSGEGYVRLSLTTADDHIRKGVDRICAAIRAWHSPGSPVPPEPPQTNAAPRHEPVGTKPAGGA
ncbi:MAG: aminotransferase class I/II-fold pyridoxal phosphate-dependent enzyme [Kyrpidia sp.]|nr:aminotransferase class I/II-fold pyridoxal phosphate-dependent enzyme [Kyrpidia sp.]